MSSKEIDDLLKFQSLNNEMSYLGQEPMEHYLKCAPLKDKEKLTGLIENLICNYFTEHYSLEEQETLLTKVHKSAAYQSEKEIDELERKLNEPNLTMQWDYVPNCESFKLPLLKQLAKRYDISLENLKTKEEITKALHQFSMDLRKVEMYFAADPPEELVNKIIPSNVLQYYSRMMEIKFDKKLFEG